MQPIIQALAREVDTICKAHRGLLKSGAFSHPLLKENERQLSELLNENGKIQQMSKKPSLVLFNKAYMFARTQFVLHSDAVPAWTDLVCIAFFAASRESIRVTEYYLLPRAQWDKATLNTSTKCKALNLASLIKIDSLLGSEDDNAVADGFFEGPSLSLTSSSSSILATTDEEGEQAEEEEDEDLVYANMRPFWLVSQLEQIVAEVPDDQCLRQYMQFMFDVFVWRRFFSDNEALKKKAIRYYSRQIGRCHTEMTLLFLSQMIDHNGGETSETIHHLRKDRKQGEWFIDLANTRLYQEWIDMEMLLFKEARWGRVLQREQEILLREHVLYLRREMPRNLWPTWFAYVMNERDEGVDAIAAAPIYWIELEDGNYSVRGEWLLKPEFDALLLSLPIVKGHTCLTPQIFQTVFLPLLYRCVLDDTRAYLFYVYYVNEQPTAQTNEVRYYLTNLRNAHHYTRESVREMSQFIKKSSLFSATSVYDLMAECGDISSPIPRKMLKKRPEFDESRSQEEIDATTSWKDRIVRRDKLCDIEDLGTKNLAPPCMQRIFIPKKGRNPSEHPTPPHLTHTDRINTMRYLIDMAYTQEEAMQYLSRGHEKDREYLLALETAYDSFAQLKRANPDGVDSQHHSFYCGGIINLPQQSGKKNFLRCVFAEQAEQKAKSHRRCDYTKDEKEVFRRACGSTLKNPPFFGTVHPVQYSLLRLDETTACSKNKK